MYIVQLYQHKANHQVFYEQSFLYNALTGFTEEELGSSEESGKDWDELEEEARRGLLSSVFWHCIRIKTCNFQ